MSLSGRDTPPSIQDGPYGLEPDEVSNFEAINGNDKAILDKELARKLGRETWDASTNWLNASRRARWTDSQRSFQSLHPSGSKYLSNDYRFRSQFFRPKTRTMVRKAEAATASAFFSNEDVVSISAPDDDDPKQQASAEILKALLQYRLQNAEGPDRVPWFLTVIGARQDCDVMGMAVAKVGWEYQEQFVRTEQRPSLNKWGDPVWDDDAQEMPLDDVDIYERIKDHPFIDLLAPENFRFEPGCDWRNPVLSSPYLIEMQPLYIQECLEKMEPSRGAPAEWLRVSTSALRYATDRDDDTTRRAREAGRVPGVDSDAWKPRDFDIAWTRIYTMKWAGQDWYFRTLAGSGELVELPRPLKEVYLHGERPYVVGYTNIEAHKTYPSSKVEMVSDIQRAVNQDFNSRFDNVMLSLQPRQFVREGTGQDIQDLRVFAPGKTIMVSGPKDQPLSNQIQWDRPPPVDPSAYQEADRLQLDLDDLVGNYNNASQAASNIVQQSATGAHLLSGEASGLNEYELRIFAETFVEPVLRLLIKCEQAYETDDVILALAAKNANLFQRFGIDKITDDLLDCGVTVRCNVGIGSSNPALKLRNFATGAQILGSMFGQTAAAGANFPEVSKELFSLLGYKDGERFFQPGFDPRVAMMQQQLQKAQQKGGGDNGAGKVQSAQIQAQSRIQEAQIKAQADQGMAQMDYNTKAMAEQAETRRAHAKLALDYHKTQQGFAHDHAMANQGFQQDMHQQAAGFQHQQGMAQQGFQHQQGMAQQGFQQDMQKTGLQNQHQQNMQDRGFQQTQAGAANQWMNDQASALINQQHQTQMAQDDRDHQAQMAQGSQQHAMQMQAMKPPPGGQGGSQSVPQPSGGSQPQSPHQFLISTARTPEEIQDNQSMREAMQSAMTENQRMGQQVGQLAQLVTESHAALAQVLAQISNNHAMQSDRMGAAMESLAQTQAQHGATNDAILQTLNRKRRVLRSADGKIEGVE